MKKRITAIILALAVAAAFCPVAGAYDKSAESDASKKLCGYIETMVPAYGSEWIVADACAGKYDFADTFCEEYTKAIKTELEENSGTLNTNKITEYERVIIALSAMGLDASNFDGYDLTMYVSDYSKVINQGVSAVIFALVALDSGCYDMPQNASAQQQASRSLYIDRILSKEVTGGGFAYYGSKADTDMTAMAVQALSKYTYRKDVAAAVERAVNALGTMQQDDGGYISVSGNSSAETAESAAQVLIAMTSLDISPDDSRFIKNGKTVLDALLAYQMDSGAFRHASADTEADGMATAQAFTALSSLERYQEDGTKPYTYTDESDAVFTDVVYNDDRMEIEALASAGIIDGMTDTTFAPDDTMTRAQFAAIVIRALGIEQKKVECFNDVADSAWYAGAVGAAYSAGIIEGRSDTIFDPEGTITDIEAKIMLARAANLRSLNDTVPEWYSSDYNIHRCEIAAAVYGLYVRLKS